MMPAPSVNPPRKRRLPHDRHNLFSYVRALNSPTPLIIIDAEFDCNIRFRMELSVLSLVLIGMLPVFVMSSEATAYS